MKQVEAILLIREQREKGRQELAFHPRPFILCGPPLRRPSPDQLSYTRRNGKFFLQIVAHPQFGLSLGQDRLIPIRVATLALGQKSREVRFDSAAQMLDLFGWQETSIFDTLPVTCPVLSVTVQISLIG